MLLVESRLVLELVPHSWVWLETREQLVKLEPHMLEQLEPEDCHRTPELELLAHHNSRYHSRREQGTGHHCMA